MKTQWICALLGFAVIACGGSGGEPSTPATVDKEATSAVAGACGHGEFAGCEARCAAQDGEACLYLGLARAFGKLPGGKPEAAAAFEKGCALKNGTACENYGTALANGWGGPPDPQGAFQYQQSACDIGSVNGCYNLANYHLGGVGTAADPQKAVAVLESRVCAALPTAEEDWDLIIVTLKGCKMLGKLFATGTGTAVDVQRANALLSMVCETGRALPAEVERGGFTHEDACEGAQTLQSR